MGIGVVYRSSRVPLFSGSCLPLFSKFASFFSIISFCLSEVCFWVEYDNVVWHRLPIVLFSFTYRLTLKGIPIWPNTAMCFFRYKQWAKCPCCISYVIRINMRIQSESNEGYASVDIYVAQTFLKCTFVWRDAVNNFQALRLWCLTPHSTIFQFNRSGQVLVFYCTFPHKYSSYLK